MSPHSEKPCVCLLTPVYNEEDNLQRYEEEVKKVLLSSKVYNFKILLIDDGSKDRSWQLIREICSRDSRFTGIRLSRNFGSHIALSAGLDQVEGDAIGILACDLQDPPEVILRFLEKWRAGAKIVWGRRQTRDDGFFRVLASNTFFRLIRRYAMPHGSKFTTGSFLLMDRQVAKCFRSFEESNRITFALVAWTGFDQEVVNYHRNPRIAGISGWSFGRMLKTMYDAFIGFSFMPVKIMTMTGISAFLITFILSMYLLICWFMKQTIPGWTSQMLVLAFFFGVQFLLMGLMGEYLFRIYAEVIRRPLYFVSDKISSDGRDKNDAS